MTFHFSFKEEERKTLKREGCLQEEFCRLFSEHMEIQFKSKVKERDFAPSVGKMTPGVNFTNVL